MLAVPEPCSVPEDQGLVPTVDLHIVDICTCTLNAALRTDLIALSRNGLSA